MAKIHTVEWTPGIVNAPALWFAMNVNWSGIFGQNLKDRFGRLGNSEIFSGIMGSPQEHHGARFQLTEEFISVYRMHPLLRDDWNFFSAQTGELLHQDEFVNIQGVRYAEPLPPGFGFSDTAFRIFILMASRRLKSDRFFTTDFRPEVYTETGIRWVTHTKMKDVLLRHYPELEPALEGLPNAFLPWNKVTPDDRRDGAVKKAEHRVEGVKKALAALNA